MQPYRSLLFAPGSRPDLVAKAIASQADAVIVDLEDAVAPANKLEAREQLASMLDGTTKPVFVRVNDPSTPQYWGDVVAVVETDAVGMFVPKVNTAAQMTELGGALEALEIRAGRTDRPLDVVPMIEDALGVRDIGDILTASKRVSSVCFSSGEQGDLVADLGCTWTPDGTGMLVARSQVLIGARAARMPFVLDGVFMNIHDLDALRVECQLAKTLGYTGKAIIHPKHIEVVHEVFTPSEAELDKQERIIRLYDEALAAGQGAVTVDGYMIDEAVIKTARHILALGGRL